MFFKNTRVSHWSWKKCSNSSTRFFQALVKQLRFLCTNYLWVCSSHASLNLIPQVWCIFDTCRHPSFNSSSAISFLVDLFSFSCGYLSLSCSCQSKATSFKKATEIMFTNLVVVIWIVWPQFALMSESPRITRLEKWHLRISCCSIRGRQYLKAYLRDTTEGLNAKRIRAKGSWNAKFDTRERRKDIEKDKVKANTQNPEDFTDLPPFLPSKLRHISALLRNLSHALNNEPAILHNNMYEQGNHKVAVTR